MDLTPIVSHTDTLNVNDMRAATTEATVMLRSLAHEDRLLLLCQLSQEELCVSELEERLDIRQPGLSQHLGVLRRENLVATRRHGRRIYYRIGDARAFAILQTLYNLYCRQEGDQT